MKRVIWNMMGWWACLTALVAAAGGLSLLLPGTLSAGILWLTACAAGVGLGAVLWRMLNGLDELCLRLEDPAAYSEEKNSSLPAPFRCALQKWSIQQKERTEQIESENRRLLLELQQCRRHRMWGQPILNTIRDAVLVVNEQDQIIFANPAAQELLGFCTEADSPPSLETAVAEPLLREKIRRCRSGRICHLRHELTFDVHSRRRIFEAVFSFLEESGENGGNVVAVLHDISREHEISQMKNEFVNQVSHELKTPLASINAYAEMLVDSEAQDAEAIRQFCSIIQNQALRLNRMIEDMLNISRIESGLVKVNKENHSIALIVRDAVEMMQSYAQEKNITLHSPPPILYDQACVDRDMISRAVINLISNAVKYTPAGGSVRVGLEVDEADGRLRVTVSDTGVGIPPEELGRLFEKFYRIQANNYLAKGTGLGLNLVKQIIETLHGGRVFVSSTVGQGSTFGFELPLASAGCAAAPV